MIGDQQDLAKNLKRRRRLGQLFHIGCAFSAFLGAVILLVLLGAIVFDGYEQLNWRFLTEFPSRFPHKAGIKSALWGSLWMMVTTAVIAIPIGVGTSVYLEEFATPHRFNRFVQLNISNLAGVPSIVYGMLGLVIFVRWFGLGRSVISGSLTMSLLILPIIIIVSQEALKTVPASIRWAAMSLGATKWQTVRDHVLPSALPGILTGTILALSRAIGETAPLIMIGALTYVAFVPGNIMDPFTVLPIQIFNWASRPQHEFHGLAAGGIFVLLTFLLSINAIAIWLRHKLQKNQKWQ